VNFKKAKSAILIVLCVITVPFLIFSNGCRTSEAEQWRPGMPLDSDKIKIGVIYHDAAQGGGWSYAHEKGISEVSQKFGLREDQILRKFNVDSTDAAMSEHAVREAIAEGANVVIATSWGFMDICERMSAEYPNVIFAHASGYRYNESNFKNYFGRFYQARYLSGIVAGLRTENNKIGFVAARDSSNSEVTGGLNAFAMGVESVNPGAVIYVRITHSWFDPAGERRAAQRLIDEGCDVIAQHCDTAEPQIAAQEAGIWGIGTNVDMGVQAPDAVLTSAIWNWGAYYTFLIGSIIDGTFTTERYYGDLADGMIDITPLSAFAAPGTEAAVAAARSRIVNDGFGVFEGVMETNDGRSVGTPGEVLSDSEIAGGINWYYRNIIVLN
jgi:basic membrane protein A